MKESEFYRLLNLRRLIPGSSILLRYRNSRPFMTREREVFGIRFCNPLGLSGMDPKGAYFNQLSDYGFGFVSLGPFQGANDREAILSAVRQIRSAPLRTAIAATLARNPSHTSEEDILEDFRRPFTLLYDFVDMVIVEMYAPEPESITDILDELLSIRLCYEKHTPILVRIPRKLQVDDLEEILGFCMLSSIDGVIVEGIEAVHLAHRLSLGKIAIVGTLTEGTAEEARALLEQGASLLEINGNLLSFGLRTPRTIMKNLTSTSL